MQTELSKLNKITFIIVALAGILLSIELIFVYYNANFNLDSGPSFCAVNDYLDCDAVAVSKYSRFLGVPLAVWGLGFYLFILGLSIFPFNKFEIFKDFKNPKSYIYVLSTFSVVLSAVLFGVSHFLIGKVCMLCQNLYLTNITLFVAAKLGHSYSELFKVAFNDIKNILSGKFWRNTAIVTVIAGISVLVLINFFKPFTPEDKIPLVKAENHYKLGTIGNLLGDKDAKLVIYEYTDYECPYCSISNAMMLRLSKEVKGIRIEHRDYPLDKGCNPLVRNSAHPNACLAIYYAKAAKKQGKFWDMSSLLFENRDNLSEKNILKLAKSIGLDTKKLKSDIEKNKDLYKKQIREDVLRASKLGIDGTPSYVIGIKKYEGLQPYEKFKATVIENL